MRNYCDPDKYKKRKKSKCKYNVMVSRNYGSRH